MNGSDSVVLVGNSVRYLAQSARAAGIAISAVDGFGDSDTRDASASYRRARGLSPQHLSCAAREVLGVRAAPWLYSAGFESRPADLQALVQRNGNLVGNDPAVTQLLADPARLFALLADLGIEFPPTMLDATTSDSDWLVKPAGGCGGTGVHRASDPLVADMPGYSQHFVNGPLCSLVFVADGADLEIIGFNRLLARFPAAGDFRFAGAISGLALEPPAKRRMLTAARRLTRSLGLRGVNGIDFVMHKGEPLFIDLNARPTATLELYEDDLPEGGYLCHVTGCRGSLSKPDSPSAVRGMRVVYAGHGQRPGNVDWPAWVTDRPMPGEYVPADQPLCTVHARGPDMETVAGCLRERVDEVSHLMVTPDEHAA